LRQGAIQRRRVVAVLRGEDREQALVLWKRNGTRAFEMEAIRDN